MKKNYLLLISLSVSILFSSCYSWFENKVDMDANTPKMNLGELLYEEEEITSLTAPTQIIVSQGRYCDKMKVHWNEVPYANSYRVERAVVEQDYTTGEYAIPDEGDFEVVGKYVYSNNFVDTILTSPDSSNKEYQNRYYYRVSAENIPKGLESSEFTETTDKSYGWLLPPPASIEAAKGEDPDFIEVRWSRVPQASKYLIYRGEKENGLGMEFIASVSGNKLSYKNPVSAKERGEEFYYKVCAVLADGVQSAFSVLALGYSAQDGAPTAPTEIEIIEGKGISTNSIGIKWKAVPKQDYTSIKYSVYRTSSISSVYENIKSNIDENTTSITDTSTLKTGIKYYYYVQAIATTKDDEILKSPFSKTGPGTPNEAVGWLLSPPSNCEVIDSVNNSKYTLRWTPAVGFETVDYYYNVYVSDTLGGEYIPLSSHLEPNSTELELGDDGYYTYEVDKKNFYRISTVNASRLIESELGPIVAPCPSAPENVIATKTSNLGGIDKYNANTNGVYPVKITWKAPADENPYGYHVYRSTKPDSSFRKVTEEPITDGSFTFIDNNETARAGTYYYYKVVSLNILGQGKKSNNQSLDTRGYGALTRDQWFREYNKSIMSSQNKKPGGLSLMHNGGTDALGSETISGEVTGTCSYNASMAGLGARIIIHYDNYVDFYVNNNPSFGYYFVLSGETNTTANMSANGSMDGTNNATTSGMYPGYAIYNNIQIKGGAAAGGYYIVCTKDKNGNTILADGNVNWSVGEE